MLVDVRNHTETHHLITVFWCGLGAVILAGIAVISFWIKRCRKVKNIMKKLQKQNGLKRSNSAIEFDVSAMTAANRRQIYSNNRSASSEQDNSDQSEHSEKSPLVSARLDNLARLFFSKSMPAETGSRDTIESVLTTRPNVRCQYSALDSTGGAGFMERNPQERAQRERALNALQEYVQNSNGRYEVIAHLDEIGSRPAKNWFLINDASVRTDRLMTLIPLPPDCVALENLPHNENPKGILMELLGSLHHPYIYPVLDLGFLRSASTNYACLVTPFNSRGSLKDLIYKAQWNEPWIRKYTRKPSGLPASQVQRLGRQILEALLFLKERGFALHGHLHSGNIILQNGAARLSGLENGLLGLSSRINAVMWSRSTTEIENVDIICFGHLLYEMCTGQEMTTPNPSMRVLEMELEHYPQILDVLGLIFDPPSGVYPSVEELVLCDLFRSIDLRELRGPCFNTIKPSLSRSTINLLHAVKKRQCASLSSSYSEANSPSTPPSTPLDRRSGRTLDSFKAFGGSEEGMLDEIVTSDGYYRPPTHMSWQHLDHERAIHFDSPRVHRHNFEDYNRVQRCCHQIESPIHYCDNVTTQSDDNCSINENKENIWQQMQQHQQEGPRLFLKLDDGLSGTGLKVFKSNSTDNLPTTDATTGLSISPDNSKGLIEPREGRSSGAHSPVYNPCITAASTDMTALNGPFNNQLKAEIANGKNSKSRRLEYSLKCLKYGRSNPSQDSAFGSLTDTDFSNASSSFRLSSFQSISSPIDESVEDVIIATTTAGKETCLELTTMPRNMVSQDSAISSPCRESSPSNFLTIDDTMSSSYSGASSSSGSTGNVRPQHFPVSLSPKIFVTTTTNSSNSSLASTTITVPPAQPPAQQQFDPPKILVNDQNSIYTTSPSKRSGTVEVFSQKYRVSSYEDMSPNRRSGKHLRNVERLAFRSLEEERRIDNAFLPMAARTCSENRVNMQTDKYKKLTHASFRISKTPSQVTLGGGDSSPGSMVNSMPGSMTVIYGSGPCGSAEMQRSITPSKAATINRQTLWRDSKFYRKTRIAKSNESLLEMSPNNSNKLSPSSMRDNHGERYTSNGSSTLTVTTAFCSKSNGSSRLYCSSKSEDLCDSDNYLRAIDGRKSCSECHLATTHLRQTAINNVASGASDDDELSFNDHNNPTQWRHPPLYDHNKLQPQPQWQQHLGHRRYLRPQQSNQKYRSRPHLSELNWDSFNASTKLRSTNIKTTLLNATSCSLPQDNNTNTNDLTNTASNLPSIAPNASSSSSSNFLSLLHAVQPSDGKSSDEASDQTSSSQSTRNDLVNWEHRIIVENSSSEDSPTHRDLLKIFTMDDAQASVCSEEKAPLLDSMEMSPMSPTETDPSVPGPDHGEDM